MCAVPLLVKVHKRILWFPPIYSCFFLITIIIKYSESRDISRPKGALEARMFVPNITSPNFVHKVYSSVSVFYCTSKMIWGFWALLDLDSLRVSRPNLTCSVLKSQIFSTTETIIQAAEVNQHSIILNNALNWSFKQKHLLFQHAPVFQTEPVQATVVLCDRKLRSCGLLVSKQKTIWRRAMINRFPRNL